MLKSKLWRNKFFRFIVFSLLIHAVLYLLFFNVSFRKHSKNMIQSLWDSLALTPAEHQKRIEQRQNFFKKLQELKQKKKKEKDNGLPAKLKPKKSDFGWVYFEDVPPAANQNHIQVPTIEQGEVAHTPTPHATELIPEKELIKKTINQTVSKEPLSKQIPSKQPKQTPKPLPETKKTQPKIEQESLELKPVLQDKIEEKPIEVIDIGRSSQHPSINIEKSPIHPPVDVVHSLLRTPTKELKPKSERKLKKELMARNADTNINSLIDELRQNPGDNQKEIKHPAENTPEIPENSDSIFTNQPSPDIQARIERIAHMQNQVASFASTDKIATTKVRGAKSAQPKDGRSIIALTKGFVENIKDEGDDLIERDGDPNKRPSFEEMKYISYEANINWALQAAWKQNFAYNPTINAQTGKAVIEFTLNEKGYVTHAELLQSTGQKELDAIIMKNLTFANPFPPLPKHFGVKSYTTGRIVQVYCSRFGM